ncbi:glycosyltransferase [Clostridium perfringens]
MIDGKKKILIVNNNLDTGGIQKSLINLLDELSKIKHFDIDLFLFSKTGEYIDEVPNNIRIIEANKFIKLLGISQESSKKLGKVYYYIRAIMVILAKILNRYIPINIILKTQKKLRNYDFAISFMHDPNKNSIYGGCNSFVLNRVIAKKKLTFVHCDFLRYGGNNKKNRCLYKKFNGIAVVSDSCKENFLIANPSLKEKVFTVTNCHNYDKIKEYSQINTIKYDKNKFNIITVARISNEKGIIRTINSIKKIIKFNNNVIWHIIGTGNLEELVKKIIKDENLNENIILYGNKENPYRYMVNADLFLLPSFHEAAPMVLDEAKFLKIPILTTKTTSAIEFIKKYECGWVCENSEEGIYYGLKYIIKNKIDYLEIKNKMKNLECTNKIALSQFLNLLEG